MQQCQSVGINGAYMFALCIVYMGQVLLLLCVPMCARLQSILYGALTCGVYVQMWVNRISVYSQLGAYVIVAVDIYLLTVRVRLPFQGREVHIWCCHPSACYLVGLHALLEFFEHVCIALFYEALL